MMGTAEWIACNEYNRIVACFPYTALLLCGFFVGDDSNVNNGLRKKWQQIDCAAFLWPQLPLLTNCRSQYVTEDFWNGLRH